VKVFLDKLFSFIRDFLQKPTCKLTSLYLFSFFLFLHNGISEDLSIDWFKVIQSIYGLFVVSLPREPVATTVHYEITQED
jgi:hypothetical protein